MLLKNKLILTCLIIALVPTLTVALIASYTASSTIESEVFAKLTAVRDTKKTQINSYFAEREGDLTILTSTIQKTLDFTSAQSLAASAHNNHEYFQEFIDVYGYYDFFLIDNSGHIFYTVAKEADYQTNLLNGSYKDSGLGKLFHQVNRDNRYTMVDFSRYAPSNNEPASFIGSPLHNGDGVSVTVALQLSIEKINALMQQRDGMGVSGESYLIGSDRLMRSDSFLDPKGHSVNASFAGSVKHNGVNTEAANQGLAGKSDNRIIIDYNGNPVLSAYTPLTINGIHWVLISEIDVDEAFAPITALNWTIFIIVLLAVCAIVAIALLVSSSILKPLGGEPLEMQRISECIAQGDLMVEFENGREPTSVYGAMQKMADQLRSVMSEIVTDSHSLASLAEETGSTSLQASTSLLEQQQSIEQVATAIEEMSVSINEVAVNAVNVASASQAAQVATINADDKLSLTISELSRLDQEISQASDAIKDLETDSHQIGTVLDVIRGIAEQTNLLALNAAIEAARAGEQGRGFAVVADEVRDLASKTQDSTKNIENMISKLQGASKKAVCVMDSSRDVCTDTMSNAQATANAIASVNNEISQISQLTGVIANAIDEQSTVSGVISQSVTVISDVAQENSASTEQVSSASHMISRIAHTLSQLTSRFKVT